jgi:hypothetical protein
MKPKLGIVITEGARENGTDLVQFEPVPEPIHMLTAAGEDLTPSERVQLERFVRAYVAQIGTRAA